MIKFIWIAAVAITFLAVPCHQAHAAKKDAVETEVPAISDKERAAISSESVDALNSKSWTVYWVLQGDKNAIPIADVFVFSGSGVTSQYLNKLGFGGSNYALHVQDDKAAVWETVQRNAEGELAAARGELRGEDLVGTVSFISPGNPTLIYSLFTNLPETLKIKSKK